MTLQFSQAMNNCYDEALPLHRGSGLKHLNRHLREASSFLIDEEALKINITEFNFQGMISSLTIILLFK